MRERKKTKKGKKKRDKETGEFNFDKRIIVKSLFYYFIIVTFQIVTT